MNEDKDEFDTDDILSDYEEAEELEAEANANLVGKKRTIITPELKEKIVARLKENKTTKEISEEFGLSSGTVQMIRHKSGMDKPRK